MRASGGNEGSMFRNIKSDKNTVVTVHNMEEFAKECVRVFCEFTGYDRTKVGSSRTPCIDESKDQFAVVQEDLSQSVKAGDSARGGCGWWW